LLKTEEKTNQYPGTAVEQISFKKKLVAFLLSIGPGLFLVGYNLGTGSITTMAVAGASYGMSLTWAVFLSCLFTFVLLVAFGRYTLITGQTALRSFHEHFGKFAAIFVLFCLIFTEMVSSIGVVAVITEAAKEWSRPVTPSGEGFNSIILAFIFGASAIYMIFVGRYSFIEKLLSLFVAIMGICFILTNFMVVPDASAVINGLVPGIPAEGNPGILIAGMLGTTMGGVVYVTRSIVVKEKGWGIGDLKLEKRDSFVSALLMFILSISVMIAAAGTLHPLGLKVENAIDMIKTLEPLAGRFATSIFVGGLICAGLACLFPHYMLVPLLLSDYLNEELSFKSWRNRAIMIFYASLGLVVPIFGGRPVFIMILTQAFTLIITPVILIFMWIIINKKGVREKYKPSLTMNISFGIITVFTIIMTVVGILGMMNLE
jgi:manganese transport protein